MFTMLPPLFARRCGTAALEPYQALLVLSRNDSSHSASGMSSKLHRVIGITFSMPALFTIPVSFPKVFAAWSTALLNFAKSRTSVAIAMALPPFLRMPSATSSFRLPSMSSSATLAPSDASLSAYARPIPCAAPVTTIALSPSRMCTLPSLGRFFLGARRAADVRARCRRPPRGALRDRRIPQVTADEDRDAAVVARQLCGRAVDVPVADGREELLVMLRRVLQRRPAQRTRNFLPQPRDEGNQPVAARDRVQLRVEPLARRELRVGRLGLRHLREQRLEHAEVLVGHERHGEPHRVALEEDPE